MKANIFWAKAYNEFKELLDWLSGAFEDTRETVSSKNVIAYFFLYFIWSIISRNPITETDILVLKLLLLFEAVLVGLVTLEFIRDVIIPIVTKSRTKETSSGTTDKETITTTETKEAPTQS